MTILIFSGKFKHKIWREKNFLAEKKFFFSKKKFFFRENFFGDVLGQNTQLLKKIFFFKKKNIGKKKYIDVYVFFRQNMQIRSFSKDTTSNLKTIFWVHLRSLFGSQPVRLSIPSSSAASFIFTAEGWWLSTEPLHTRANVA